jgi:hypothetical protein
VDVVIGRPPLLGISVGAADVRAILWWRDAIRWAGAAPYETVDELADAIARLAGEAGMPVRRARVVLEREVVQLRSIVPAPPLKPAALRRYVALEAQRLFRKNGAALVTDGVRISLTKTDAGLWAGAAAEPLVQAILAGCVQAGLSVDALGPAADVLPHALETAQGPVAFSNGGTTEVLELGVGGVWQSRMVRGTSPAPSREFTRALAALGDETQHFAAAYGAAVALTRLSLLPSEARAARERHSRRRLVRLVAVGAMVWMMAGATYVGRLAWTARGATLALGGAAAAVDSALTVRRQLGLARATLATAADAERRRSHHLALLAAVTRAFGDSTYLVAFQVTPDGLLRIAGYAPVAARVVAALERVEGLSDVRLEGPVTRETRDGKRETWDRFAIVARRELLR